MIDGLRPYPKYKDSGVPWLGEVPEHWEVQRLKYLFREIDERSETGDEELLSVSHLTGVTPRREKNVTMFLAESNVGHKLCAPGDVVVNTMWAWMAALGVARQHGMVSPSYAVYRPRHDALLEPAFVDRLLRTEALRAEYVRCSTGVNSSRMRLYPEQFLTIRIALPSTGEQEAIGRFLAHVDRQMARYIRAKKKLIALLNEQKQAIIHRAVMRGLDSSVRLKSSGVEWLHSIPVHWQLRRVRTLVTRIDQGHSPQADAGLANEGEWGVLKAGCVNHGVFRETEHKRLPSTYAVDELLAVREGDVLVSRASGSPRLVGSVARVLSEPRFRLMLSDKTFRLVVRENVDADFVVAAMNTRYYRNQVERAISGAEGLANNLPLTALRDFYIALPPPEEAKQIAREIARTIAPIMRAQAAVETEISANSEYRTRVIADVVTGKLDVRVAAVRLPVDESSDEFPKIGDTEEQTGDESAAETEAVGIEE